MLKNTIVTGNGIKIKDKGREKREKRKRKKKEKGEKKKKFKLMGTKEGFVINLTSQSGCLFWCVV